MIATPFFTRLVTPFSVIEMCFSSSSSSTVLSAFLPLGRPFGLPDLPGLKGAKNKLVLHPTVKPVALVAHAIRDALRRETGQILEIENDLEIEDSGFETAEIVKNAEASRREERQATGIY